MSAADKDRYLARAAAEVEKAKARRETYAGPCSECRWSRIGMIERHCVHPAVELASFNTTDHYGSEAITRCGQQRDTNSIYGPVLCGPDGALFEPRISFLKRLLSAIAKGGQR